MREILRDHDDRLLVVEGFTVRDAVEDWLAYGLTNRDPATRTTCAHLCRKHVLPHLGARKLRELSATEVDAWLVKLSATEHQDASGRPIVPE